MRISKEKLVALRRRASGLARRGASASAQPAMAVAAGAVASLAASWAGANSTFVAQNWWATPALLAALGIVARKSPRLAPASSALLGAAGFAGVTNYRMAQASQRASDAKGVEDYETGLLQGGASFSAPAFMPRGTNAYDEEVSSTMDTIGL